MAYLSTTKDKLLRFFSLSFKNMLKTVVYSASFHLFIIAFRLFGYKKSKKTIDMLFIPNKSTVDINGNFLKNESTIASYATCNSPFKSTCLERSLFTYALLGLYGIKCDLKIGVNGSARDFSAHAWIEHEGNILNDTPEIINKISPF